MNDKKLDKEYLERCNLFLEKCTANKTEIEDNISYWKNVLILLEELLFSENLNKDMTTICLTKMVMTKNNIKRLREELSRADAVYQKAKTASDNAKKLDEECVDSHNAFWLFLIPFIIAMLYDDKAEGFFCAFFFMPIIGTIILLISLLMNESNIKKRHELGVYDKARDNMSRLDHSVSFGLALSGAHSMTKIPSAVMRGANSHKI